MRLNEFVKINEAAYQGNIGMMEMVQFHQVATPELKQLMQKFIDEKTIMKLGNY